ncbi:conserved hypothetical protein [Culex quinquefasciatus]|uniref:Uncharacterized protein n=1 Tax=Culex quinquefasciatus TaxID=7176 RepID=B0W456_CULQU|nr:conserved hypothetical protein [Culex quinquefasciatus]|eukprot:XP_001843490.1 conserved hypothetical protein [Culex quinquefasciatus]
MATSDNATIPNVCNRFEWPSSRVYFAEAALFNVFGAEADDRRIIVTTRLTFKAIIDERKYLNGIYIVYDETESPIYHYNRYKKSLHKLDVLQNDPLLASTRDLAGMPFSTLEKHFIDYAFLELAAMRFNGSIELTRIASFYLVYLNYKYTVHYDYGLNKPIPSIYVITDPLDISSWISLFSAVIGLSLIRTFISGMYTVRHILRDFVLVLECFTLGTKVLFHRNLEQLLFGLFLLLTVVLINAYQSMIISYLMSPRFYPELDTLELLNETCCWEPFRLAPSYNFKQLDKCSSITMFGYVENDNRLLIEQAYDNSYCVKIDEWQWMELNQNPLLAMTSGLYRWSNKIINEWPSVAWLMGDPVVAEKVSTLGPRFYPELDTLQLINDSCCWDQSEYMSYYNLKRLDKCPEIDMYSNLDSEDLDLVRQAYAATFCTIVDKVQRMVIDHFPYLAKDSGMYRWSKQTINNWPLLAWTNGDPIVLERMLILSRIYYAENALNSIFGKAFSELKEPSLESTGSRNRKPRTLARYARTDAAHSRDVTRLTGHPERDRKPDHPSNRRREDAGTGFGRTHERGKPRE